MDEGADDPPATDTPNHTKTRRSAPGSSEKLGSSSKVSSTSSSPRNSETRISKRQSTEADATTNKQDAASNSVQKPPAMAVSGPENTSDPLNSAPGTADTSDTTGPSPYGTRSRNRGGNARPNYAEDRENEMDYEWSAGKKGKGSAEHTVAAQTPDGEKTATHARKAVASSATTTKTTTSAPLNISQGQKDHNIASSSFSVSAEASPAPQPQTRKRKAPGSATVNGATAAPSQVHSTAATTRKSTHHHVGGHGRESNMVSFDESGGLLRNGVLVADDKTEFRVNDTVYLVCEPPGEPYYIARIMEFHHVGNTPRGRVESVRVNWMYRPRDIARKATDNRLIFVSMHSDFAPITSLRGKCRVVHRARITDLDAFRKTKDSFYYTQMYERYIHRYYEVIPTEQVINVPEKVKKVLDERWEFVVTESSRAKELTSAIKTCKRCVGYCANNDSVDCAMCKNTYHMNCVQPPLAKKPARGFAWSCGPCSRRQERKLEARNTPMVGEDGADVDMDDVMDEEDEDRNASSNATSGNSPSSGHATEHQVATKEQLAQAKLWPYRYLGIHAKVEDALDYDDRIYPRASSRLGPRHQANVSPWYGHHVEYVKASEGKRSKAKGQSHKKDAPKLSKEALAALEAEKLEREKRPKWIVDAPTGYIRRGEDIPNSDPANTAKLQFRLPEVGEKSTRGEEPRRAPVDEAEREKFENDLEAYMSDARAMAPSDFALADYNTNYLDKALEIYYANNLDSTAALKQLGTIDPKKDLKEPRLNKEEVKRFEEGIVRYGSNLGDVIRHVGKVQKFGDIVRFYYVWKKTASGEKLWGGHETRKGKKQAKKIESTALLDDVADDYDDSAFDNEKAMVKKRGFECKHCSTRTSRVWRRAPQTAPGTTVPADHSSKGKDKSAHLMVALCHRCANLWRKYALHYESIDELAKKVQQTGGRAFRRKQEEDLLCEVAEANKSAGVLMNPASAAAAQALGVDIPANLIINPEQEAARKKAKLAAEKEKEVVVPAPPPVVVEPPKKKVVVEKLPEPPLVPEQPKLRHFPCAVCWEFEPGPGGEDYFCCRYCRLTVHRNCYGIPDARSPTKWACDMCVNDTSNQYSTTYECVLCTSEAIQVELYDQPKQSHKKKTDREREKERLEKEMVEDAKREYRRKQQEAGRPIYPREALKPTAGNKWAHVLCSVWVPGIKFREPQHLDKAEGIMAIPHSTFGQTCKICKSSKGVCVTCHKCPATFHVTCANKGGYHIGFDVTPVKSTRRDIVDVVTLGNEKGQMEPVIFCKDHAIKSILHPMSEMTSEKQNALQLYVRHFKQADISLTGTVRKADMVTRSRSMTQGATTNGHRGSVSNGPSTPTTAQVNSLRASPEDITVKSEEVDEDGDRVVHLTSVSILEPVEKECVSCRCTTSPKWHKLPRLVQANGVPLAPGFNGLVPPEGRRGSYNDYLCHRCHLKRAKDPLPMARPIEAAPRLPAENHGAPIAPPPATVWPLPPTGHPLAHPQQPRPGIVPHSPSHGPIPLVNGITHTPPQPHVVHLAQPRSPYPPGPHGPPGPPPFAPLPPDGYDGRPPSAAGHAPPGQPPTIAQGNVPPRRPSVVYAQYPVYPPGMHHGNIHYNMPNGSPTTPYRPRDESAGPTGPPRADSNPFAMPTRSPRSAFHGSPRPRTSDRPETPQMTNGRATTWDREREERERREREDREREEQRQRDRARERESEGRRTPMTNGASASPNLRNLLH